MIGYASVIEQSWSLAANRICFGRQKINLSIVFAGQNVGAPKRSAIESDW
jgi:hypothetical protein